MKAVDLFCGCGGLSLGLTRAGITLCAAYDAWGKAVEVYRSNIDDHPCFEFNLADADLAAEHIRDFAPELIAGGPPCQDFSHAGRRTEGRNASLTESFGSIINSVLPNYFLMENVDRAQSSEAYLSFKTQVTNAGYDIVERVIDASLVGVPQRRKRFFCVGVKNGEARAIGEYLDSNLARTPTTIRDYLGDELGVEHYYRHPRNYNRRGVFSIDEPSPTVRGVNRPVPSGYQGHHGDTAKVTKTLRPLSTLERARLQTFPKGFRFEGTKTDLEQMIGNAVPVDLAKYVGSSICNFHKASIVDASPTKRSMKK